MRISITDRCNLRCAYCMPEGLPLVPAEDILSFEEIGAVCRAAAELGIRRFKITGGEPLVRRGCPELIGRLKEVSGVEQVTLTTNGILLGRYLGRLVENGLSAVNISLDTLDGDTYRRLTGFPGLPAVLGNLERAVRSGLRVKVNAVLQKGVNDGEWEELANLSRERKVDVRFIELMPIGCGKGREALEGGAVLSALLEKYPGMRKDEASHGNGPAVYYRIPGFAGSVGFINGVHDKFCSSCNRIRMTAKGELKPCLCYSDSVDMRSALRAGGPGEEQVNRAKAAIREAVRRKPGMHCFECQEQISEDRKMVQIGG